MDSGPESFKMHDKIKTKLQAALNKKAESDSANTAAEERKVREAEQRKKDQVATNAFWPEAVQRMKTAIASVNEVIEDSDMHFEVGKFVNKPDENEYGGFSIHLKSTDKKERYIHLNISDVGFVRPVFLIPHSGKAPHGFNLSETSPEFYEEMLTDFFGQVIDVTSKNR
jgi:hypothetical protein